MSLKAGTARICITPPLGVVLGGVFTEPTAQYVHDDLWAKCLFLENDGNRLALVSCDLLGLPYSAVEAALGEIRRHLPLAEDQLIVNCTHNHSGPDTASIIHRPLDHPYTDELPLKLAEVVVEAAKDLKPASVGVASGELTSVCANRRIRLKNGKVRMNWGYTPEEEMADPGPIDPLLGVLRVDSADGRPMAVVVHYTCHAAVVSPAPRQISADYPGYACRMIERLYGNGITAMFLNGAFGNINHILKPRDFNAMSAGTAADRPFEEAERVGQSVAARALELLPEIATGDAAVASTAKTITVGLRNPPVKDLSEAEAVVNERRARLRKAEGEGDSKAADQALIDLIYSEQWAAFFRNGRKEDTMPLSAFRIGDLAAACISGEPFVETGFRIKKQSPFASTWVIGNTNGYTGYLPTEESFSEGGYEVQTCGWSKWRTDADKIVARESVELLKKLNV